MYLSLSLLPDVKIIHYFLRRKPYFNFEIKKSTQRPTKYYNSARLYWIVMNCIYNNKIQKHVKWFCFVNSIQFGNTQFSDSVFHGCHRFGQGFWSQTHRMLVKIHLFGFLDLFLCVTHCQMFCAVEKGKRPVASSAKTTWCFKSCCLFGFLESCQPEPQGLIKNHRSPQKSLEDSLFHLLQLRLWMAEKNSMVIFAP